MNVERAREILDPEHRENYDGMEAHTRTMRHPVRTEAFANTAVSRCERSGGNGSATM